MTAEETLAHAEIFSDFPREFLERVAQGAEVREYPAGTIIVREEDPADAFYVLKSGEIEVVHGAGTSEEVIITHLEPGSFFGEMAIVREGTRTATVRTTKVSEIVILPRESFEAILHQDPNAAAFLMPRLARRLHMIRHPEAGHP